MHTSNGFTSTVSWGISMTCCTSSIIPVPRLPKLLTGALGDSHDAQQGTSEAGRNFWSFSCDFKQYFWFPNKTGSTYCLRLHKKLQKTFYALPNATWIFTWPWNASDRQGWQPGVLRCRGLASTAFAALGSLSLVCHCCIHSGMEGEWERIGLWQLSQIQSSIPWWPGSASDCFHLLRFRSSLAVA